MPEEIRFDGKIATLRRAKKTHQCRICSGPIPIGHFYWEIVYGGASVRNSKFPSRTHIGDCLNKYFEVY